MNSKATLLGGGVIIMLVTAFAGYLYGVNSTLVTTTTTETVTTELTTASTVSTVPDAYEQVASAYANQLLLLDARNISALASGFASNATVEWKGYANGLQQGRFVNRDLASNYTGSKEISTLLSAFLTNAYYILVSNETQTIGAKGNSWIVNSTFHFAGNSSTVGTFDGTIVAQESYVHIGNTWLISNEVWNFTYYETEVLD